MQTEIETLRIAKLEKAFAVLPYGSRRNRVFQLIRDLKWRATSREMELEWDREWDREWGRHRRQLVIVRPVPKKEEPFKRYFKKPFCG